MPVGLIIYEAIEAVTAHLPPQQRPTMRAGNHLIDWIKPSAAVAIPATRLDSGQIFGL
jgi:hypothetical protein